MRTPISWVLLLAIAVICGTWWAGTRHADFLSPPNESKLTLIRYKIEASIPPDPHPDDTPPPPTALDDPAPPLPQVAAPPSIDLGDLSRPPSLLEYHLLAGNGAARLSELAALLETKGASQRALLAWERVIDSTQPDAEQARLASTAIQRLRATQPDWNTDRKSLLAITLHARTHQKTPKALSTALDEIAHEIERASAGILKVTATVAPARRGKSSTSSSIDLWFSGSANQPAPLTVRTCTPASTRPLHDELLLTIYGELHDQLAHANVHASPVTLTAAAIPLDWLRGQVTRACWHELGTQLNRPAAKHE